MSDWFTPRVHGYNISKGHDGMYSVAVNNGNYGASRMNKAQFDEFITKQRKEGNVEPSIAGNLLRKGLFATGLLVAGDLIFAKGKHLKSIFNMFNGKTALKELAQERVACNVVKRKNLDFDEFLDTVNKFSNNKGIQEMNICKAPEKLVEKLKLNNNALVIADNKGNPLKIFDTAKVDSDIMSQFKDKDVFKIIA